MLAFLSALGAAAPARHTAGRAALMERKRSRMAEAARLGRGGKKREGIAVAARALPALEAAHGPLSVPLAEARLLLAKTHESEGEWKEADRLRRLALLTFHRVGPTYHRTVDSAREVRTGQILEKLGEARGQASRAAVVRLEEARALAGRDEHEQALALAKRAWADIKGTVGDKHPGHAKARLVLADLHARLGDGLSAEPHALAAFDLARATVGTAHPRFADTLQMMEDIMARVGEPYADRTSSLALRIRRNVLGERHADTRASLPSLAAHLKRKERDKEPPAPAALAESLPAGAALIDDFYRAKLGSAGEGAVLSLAAFVTRKGRSLVRVELGRGAAVDEAAARWRRALMRGTDDAGAGAERRGLAWTPLARHLEGASLILVSPDRQLGAVAFAALPGGKKGSRLAEESLLAVVPVPEAMKGKAARSEAALLAMGGIDYDRAKASPVVAGTGSAPRGALAAWSALPRTRTEAEAVEASFLRRFEGRPVSRLGGKEATKQALRAGLPKASIAHLATHGYFAPGEGTARWHPLLLSGLALSGANRVPKPGEEDGILTALEVSETDLSGLELAVLSACETGLGKEAGGEGVLGLQRAFAAAGARSVVSSLWKVDDEATRALMVRFYSNLRGKGDGHAGGAGGGPALDAQGGQGPSRPGARHETEGRAAAGEGWPPPSVLLGRLRPLRRLEVAGRCRASVAARPQPDLRADVLAGDWR
ncbi:MAG: CHAT domain-containing protein [Gemmataceae bacterium]|nr:CHAT domain-containing protein [Gemmataceae bacterium]